MKELGHFINSVNRIIVRISSPVDFAYKEKPLLSKTVQRVIDVNDNSEQDLLDDLYKNADNIIELKIDSEYKIISEGK